MKSYSSSVLFFFFILSSVQRTFGAVEFFRRQSCSISDPHPQHKGQRDDDREGSNRWQTPPTPQRPDALRAVDDYCRLGIPVSSRQTRGRSHGEPLSTGRCLTSLIGHLCDYTSIIYWKF